MAPLRFRKSNFIFKKRSLFGLRSKRVGRFVKRAGKTILTAAAVVGFLYHSSLISYSLFLYLKRLARAYGWNSPIVAEAVADAVSAVGDTSELARKLKRPFSQISVDENALPEFTSDRAIADRIVAPRFSGFLEPYNYPIPWFILDQIGPIPGF